MRTNSKTSHNPNNHNPNNHHSPNTPHNNEKGAIDLASIMVGIIVLGVIGGVVAATVFAVIPWSQDNAAKEQLKNVTEAQAVYQAASIDGTFAPYDTLVKGADANAEGTAGIVGVGSSLPGVVPASAGLVTLDGVSRPLSITLNTEKNCYVSVIQSASGKYYSVTNTHTNPEVFERGTTPGCVDATVLEREVAGAVGENPIAGPEVPETPEVPESNSLMVSTWDISTTKTIQLPVQGSIGEGTTINWGDGTVEPLTATPSHTYTTGSAATVTIDGSFTEWSMGQVGYGSYTSGPQLRTITKWDDEVGTTSLAYGFSKAPNLTLVKEIPNTVTDLSYAFGFYPVSSTFNGDISGWDTSNVTDMKYMFYGANDFNQPVNFDTSKVTNMSAMFWGTHAFNQPVEFDTSSVTDMASMFEAASVFNQPVNFDTRNVTDMSYMFNSAYLFNQPVNFDTRNVTNMSGMFQRASVFNQPVNFNTGNVFYMSGMFNNARAFNQPVNFTNTSKVYQMGSMFWAASSFNQPLNFDTRGVSTMSEMFWGASSFNQDISHWNVEKVQVWTRFKDSSPLSDENTPAKFRNK